MGRFPCRDHETSGLKKGPWTPEEDKKLVDYISKNGQGCWRSLPKHAGLNRCGKSCRLRWTNYLRPDIKRGKFSEEKERIIINLHSALGNRWSKIANSLPGRTDNEIKNYWNTYLRKKLLQMGIDPNTHKPRADLNQLLNLSHLLNSSHLTSLIMNSANNISTHHNWDNNALKLQAQTTDQLVKIQLLQNLFQVINSANTSLATNNASTSTSTSTSTITNAILLGAQNLNPTTIFSKQYQIQNLGFAPQDGPTDYYSPPSDHPSSLACIEDGESNNNIIINSANKGLQGIHEDVINPLPGLVSEPFTSGNIFSNQVENNEERNSTAFEDWQMFMDDNGDSTESYWKDILESMSDSQTL